MNRDPNWELIKSNQPKANQAEPVKPNRSALTESTRCSPDLLNPEQTQSGKPDSQVTGSTRAIPIGLLTRPTGDVSMWCCWCHRAGNFLKKGIGSWRNVRLRRTCLRRMRLISGFGACEGVIRPVRRVSACVLSIRRVTASVHSIWHVLARVISGLSPTHINGAWWRLLCFGRSENFLFTPYFTKNWILDQLVQKYLAFDLWELSFD